MGIYLKTLILLVFTKKLFINFGECRLYDISEMHGNVLQA